MHGLESRSGGWRSVSLLTASCCPIGTLVIASITSKWKKNLQQHEAAFQLKFKVHSVYIHEWINNCYFLFSCCQIIVLSWGICLWCTNTDTILSGTLLGALVQMFVNTNILWANYMSATQCSHVDTVKMTGLYHTIISNVNRERSEKEKPSSEWQLLWMLDGSLNCWCRGSQKYSQTVSRWQGGTRNLSNHLLQQM